MMVWVLLLLFLLVLQCNTQDTTTLYGPNGEVLALTPTYLLTPCRHVMQNNFQPIFNASVIYVANPMATTELFHSKVSIQGILPNTTATNNNSNSVVLFLNGVAHFGGYPEDLSDVLRIQAAAAGIQLQALVLYDVGDDAAADWLAVYQWRSLNKCTLPVFKTSMAYENSIRQAASVTITTSPTPRYEKRIAIAISFFILDVCILPPALIFLSLSKIRGFVKRDEHTGRVKIMWNAGTVICICAVPLAVVSAVFQLQFFTAALSTYGYQTWMNYQAYMALSALAAILSFITTFLIAHSFHLAIGLSEGKNLELVKRSPMVILGMTMGVMSLLAVSAAAGITGEQLSNFGNLSVFVTAFYLVFRILLGAYFFWGYLYVICLRRKRLEDEKKRRLYHGDGTSAADQAVRNMAVRLILAAVCIFVTSTLLILGSVPALIYFNFGWEILTKLALFFNGLTVVVEVSAVTPPFADSKQTNHHSANKDSHRLSNSRL